MKEEEYSPEEELDEMEASNLLDSVFRVMIIRILNNTKKHIEMIKKKIQSGIKYAISEINNILKGINSRLGEAEDQMNFKKWEELKKHWMTEGNNICIMGMPGGEESEQGIENLFEEIMTETSLIQWREKTHIPGNSVNPKQVGPKDPTPRHIVIKMIRLKDKERILTAAREKHVVTYNGAPMRLLSDYSSETLQARRE